MRFPWLQVDSDFISSRASELGALLGISRREALGLALDLWAWVLSRSPADRPPDGILSGSDPVAVLASAVSWPVPERLASALVEVGLVEVLPKGLRIKGLDRYKATWEKNRRRPNRNRPGPEPEPPPVPTRKTQTQTQTQKEASATQTPAEAALGDDLPDATEHARPDEQAAPTAPGGADAHAQPARQTATHLPGMEPAPQPGKPTRADREWVEWACQERAKVAPPTSPQEAKLLRHQWAGVSAALKLHGRLLLTQAFRLFLADDYARENGFPLALFISQWASWVGRAQAADVAARTGRGAGRRGGNRTDTSMSDWSSLPEGGIDLSEPEGGTAA